MIRTAIFTAYLALLILIGGPLLVLYGLIFGANDTYYRVGVDAVLFIVRAVGIRTRVEGLENIPAGTCLFAANHASNIDPPVLVGAIPRRIGILAKKSLFAIPIMGTAFRMAHFIPVDRAQRRKRLGQPGPRGEIHAGRHFLSDLSGRHAQPRRPFAAVQTRRVFVGDSRGCAGSSGGLHRRAAHPAEEIAAHTPRGNIGSFLPADRRRGLHAGAPR